MVNLRAYLPSAETGQFEPCSHLRSSSAKLIEGMTRSTTHLQVLCPATEDGRRRRRGDRRRGGRGSVLAPRPPAAPVQAVRSARRRLAALPQKAASGRHGSRSLVSSDPVAPEEEVEETAAGLDPLCAQCKPITCYECRFRTLRKVGKGCRPTRVAVDDAMVLVELPEARTSEASGAGFAMPLKENARARRTWPTTSMADDSRGRALMSGSKLAFPARRVNRCLLPPRDVIATHKDRQREPNRCKARGRPRKRT
jgi:hypothetical protein